MNIVQTENNNVKYKKKFKYMKMRVKSLIIENAALCDEIAKVQENIQIVKDERKFLLCKLMDHENKIESSQYHYKGDVLSISNGSKTKPKKRRSQEEPGKSLVP